MCFAVQFCFPNPNNKKKPAHPGDKSPERLASNSSIHFPSEERLASSGLASRHIGSLLNGGGDLLQAHKYHIAKGCQNSFYFKPRSEITYHLLGTKKFKFILGTSVEKCDYSIL
jgi:hypothetical protein